MRSTTGSDRLLIPLAITVIVVMLGVGYYVYRDQLRDYWSRERRLVVTAWESSHPIVSELADGTIRSGDPIEALVERHPPTHRVSHDRYTTLCYIEGNRETYVVARDGNLVFARQAGNGIHPCTFFSTMTRDDELDWSASFQRMSHVPKDGKK